MGRLIKQINFPADLRKFKKEDLKQISDELRDELIDVVSETGGHLGAGLGVVELTVALHYVFNTPKDKLVWDVSHQCYPHKIITGRRDKIKTLRKGGGLSGFTKRTESEYDPFGAAHSSTSISSTLGMAVAKKLSNDKNNVIAVIGDGAMSAGMAYEAMNNAGALKSKLIVVLNDNDMSIARPVGAMSNYLAKLLSGKLYFSLRETIKMVISAFSKRFSQKAGKAEDMLRNIVTGGTLFSELGFYYVGPVDGHDVDNLVPICENVKTGEQIKSSSTVPSYTKVFAQTLVKHAKKDSKIVAITAAMPDGTGLDIFRKEFPDRTFDVGIAEQHAVTFAAGLATENYKPYAAIYSTFLQRAYDQVVHDVAIQSLPVRFAIDRAGLVGADGPTHAGSFDITYLATLPNFVVMAASDEAELVKMINTSTEINDRPCAFRYPRGTGLGVDLPNINEIIEIGKSRVIQEGKKLAVLNFGARLNQILRASENLKKKGVNVTIVDARFAKPLDENLIWQLATTHEAIVTIEEGSIGGFGSHVVDFLSKKGLIDNNLKFRSMTLPDIFIDQDLPENMYKTANLDAHSIEEKILDVLNSNIVLQKQK